MTTPKVLFLFVYMSLFSLTCYGQQKDILIIMPDYNDVSNLIEQRFKKIGIPVYRDVNSAKTDKIYKDNPNTVLICQVGHTYNYPHTAIGIRLFNNQSILVFESNHNTIGKSFVSFNMQKDREWVVDKVFSDFQSSYVNSKFIQDLNLDFPEVEMTSDTEESLKKYYSENELHPIEGIYKSYQTKTLGHYIFGIKKRESEYVAIIIEVDQNPAWMPGEIKAYFEPTSMRNFYSAQWLMGNKAKVETFAQLESPAVLSIEFNDITTREKHIDKFVKIYPQSEDLGTIAVSKRKSTGTGFSLSTDGLIATNAHVVSDSDSIYVEFNIGFGRREFKAKILLIDEANDVALLSISDDSFTGFTNIPFSVHDGVKVGAKVYSLGYPLSSIMGDNMKVSDGIISSLSGIADDVRYLQTTVPIQPGNSGSPLFDERGRVVGIISATLSEKAVGTSVQNVNYAVKSSYLISLYNMLPDRPDLAIPVDKLPSNLEDQIEALREYICLIKVF